MSMNHITEMKRPPTHPGELLHEQLEEIGMSVSAAARHLGISRVHLHRVLSGKNPVSGEVAVKLGRMFGNGPDLWARMQLAHDLWYAERAVPLDAVPRLERGAAG